MRFKCWSFFAASLVTAGFSASIALTPDALAVVPMQDNPVFTTPVPEEQKLGPDPAKPFTKGVVTDNTDYPADQAIPKVGEIKFDGNRFYRDSVIEGQLKSLLDKQGESLDKAELERSLVRINKQNPYKLKATIQKGSEPDTTDIYLDVYERLPWQVTTTLDNQGRPGIGGLRGGVGFTNESVLGYGDKFSVQYLQGRDANYVGGSYDFPINRSGGTLGLISEFSHNETDPEGSVPMTYGEHFSLGLKYTQPFDKARMWTGDIGFMGRHVNVNGTHPDPRFVFAGLKFNKPDKYGQSLVYLQSFLGEQWVGGDSRFWRVRGQGTRSFNLPKDNKLVFRTAAQYSPDALPAVQMFPLAGAYGVRGFSEGMLYGDSGLFASVEHYWPIPFLGRVNPDLSARLRGVSFFDYGHGWLRNSRAVADHGTDIMATGVGLRYKLNQYLQGFMDVAWGLGSPDNFTSQNWGGTEINPSARIHFGIRSDLLSKDYTKI